MQCTSICRISILRREYLRYSCVCSLLVANSPCPCCGRCIRIVFSSSLATVKPLSINIMNAFVQHTCIFGGRNRFENVIEEKITNILRCLELSIMVLISGYSPNSFKNINSLFPEASDYYLSWKLSRMLLVILSTLECDTCAIQI